MNNLQKQEEKALTDIKISLAYTKKQISISPTHHRPLVAG